MRKHQKPLGPYWLDAARHNSSRQHSPNQQQPGRIDSRHDRNRSGNTSRGVMGSPSIDGMNEWLQQLGHAVWKDSTTRFWPRCWLHARRPQILVLYMLQERKEKAAHAHLSIHFFESMGRGLVFPSQSVFILHQHFSAHEKESESIQSRYQKMFLQITFSTSGTSWVITHKPI